MFKVSSMLTLGMLVLAALIAINAAMPPPAQAQCGDTQSSCYLCHLETHPVCGTTEWHSIYGHRYACWNCHGGNDTAQTKELAHVGLVRNPLQDAYTSCYPCHAEGYQALAERFAKTIGVTVSTHAPLSRTVAPAGSIPVQPTLSPAAPTLAAPSDAPGWQWLLWLSPVAALLVLGWLVWKRRTV